MKMMLEDSRETITWELFKKKFYAEYFPDSVRYVIMLIFTIIQAIFH